MSIVIAAALLLAIDNPSFRKPFGSVDMKRDEVRRLGAHFGNCVVKKQPSLARTYVLNTNPVFTVGDAVEHQKIVRKLSIGNCLLRAQDMSREVGMRFTGDALRFVLADAFFRRELASRPPLANLDQIPALPQTGVALGEFGECVVRRDPQGSYGLLRTSVVTPDENRAFDALKPAMSGCLPAQTVRLNRELVRGVVAYSYFRLSNTARPAGPSGTPQ